MADWKGAIADIAALKGQDTSNLPNYVGFLVASQKAWYMLDLSATDTADDDAVVAPNTGAGRWFKSSATTENNAVGGGDVFNGANTTIQNLDSVNNYVIQLTATDTLYQLVVNTQDSSEVKLPRADDLTDFKRFIIVNISDQFFYVKLGSDSTYVRVNGRNISDGYTGQHVEVLYTNTPTGWSILRPFDSTNFDVYS